MDCIPVQVNALFVRTPFFSHKEVSELCGEKRKPCSEVGVQTEEQETEGRS